MVKERRGERGWAEGARCGAHGRGYATWGGRRGVEALQGAAAGGNRGSQDRGGAVGKAFPLRGKAETGVGRHDRGEAQALVGAQEGGMQEGGRRVRMQTAGTPEMYRRRIM